MSSPVVHERNADEGELDRMIEQDPHHPGRHNARLADRGHHVWVIIGHLRNRNMEVEGVMRDFHLPRKAVFAAVRYYEQNRDLFDAKLLLEREVDDAQDA